MKTFLYKLLHGFTALLMLFSNHHPAKEVQGATTAGHAPKLPKQEMMMVLKGKTGVPYTGRTRDVKLLQKRLAEYRRSVWKGDYLKRELAEKRLNKQWKKVQRNQSRSLKVIHKDTSLSA